MFKVLLVDDEFQSLSIPLPGAEYASLDFMIKKEVGHPSVTVWKNYIIDGFEQYNLYQKYHRYYSVDELFFANRDQAVAWICRHQLERNNLTVNARAWLLYRLYCAERKIIRKKQAKEDFQYKQMSPSSHFEDDPVSRLKEESTVLERISSEYKLSSATLRRYAVFGRGLDQLEKRYPGTRNRILTGKLEVARVHMTDLLSMPQSELREMIDNPKCRRLVPPKQEKAENRIANGNTRTKVIRLNTGIKQMPAFDPDAELKGLTFTVSAWKNAVSRAKEKTDFNKATVVGRYRLKHALDELLAEINELNRMLEVHFND